MGYRAETGWVAMRYRSFIRRISSSQPPHLGEPWRCPASTSPSKFASTRLEADGAGSRWSRRTSSTTLRFAVSSSAPAISRRGSTPPSRYDGAPNVWTRCCAIQATSSSSSPQTRPCPMSAPSRRTFWATRMTRNSDPNSSNTYTPTIGCDCERRLKRPERALRATAHRVELRVAHADGTWHDVELIATNGTDDPAVRGVVCNVRDVTDLLKARQEIAANGRRFEAMLANLSDIVSVIDGDGKMTYVSPATDVFSGVTPRPDRSQHLRLRSS